MFKRNLSVFQGFIATVVLSVFGVTTALTQAQSTPSAAFKLASAADLGAADACRSVRCGG